MMQSFAASPLASRRVLAGPRFIDTGTYIETKLKEEEEEEEE